MDKQERRAFVRRLMAEYYPAREKELERQESALAGGAAQDATENKPVKSIAQPARVGKGTRITQTMLF